MAGREYEKAAITEALKDLEEGFNPSANIALIGPRGNGKTVLLRWVEARVGRSEGSINCVVLNPDYFRSHAVLVEAFADQWGFSDHSGDGFSASINVLGSGINLSLQDTAKKLLRPVLENRCSGSGLVILIDEAHTLDHNLEVARAFFNDVQVLAGNGRPLLLILAGTPDTSPRLNRIEATFWNRLDKIGIGLLDAAAAQDALRTPLERMGYCIEAAALDQAAHAAQCYPYFLQVVGRELQRAAKAERDKPGRGNGIGNAILEEALKKFRSARNTYYADRYQELRDRSILPSAEAVARLFVTQKKKSISTTAIEAAIARSIDMKLEEKARTSGGVEPAAWVEEELRNVGFIWSQFGNERFSEPGIPSLMDYVMESAHEREQIRATTRS